MIKSEDRRRVGFKKYKYTGTIQAASSKRLKSWTQAMFQRCLQHQHSPNVGHLLLTSRAQAMLVMWWNDCWRIIVGEHNCWRIVGENISAMFSLDARQDLRRYIAQHACHLQGPIKNSLVDLGAVEAHINYQRNKLLSSPIQLEYYKNYLT